MTLAHAIMVATKLGIFEVLAKQACTTHEAAALYGLDQHATEALLFAFYGSEEEHEANQRTIDGRGGIAFGKQMVSIGFCI